MKVCYQENPGNRHFIALVLFGLIGFVWSASPVSAKKVPPPLHSVDLNTATEKQLEQLPGVGPTTAKAIIEFRTKAGRFRRVEDLLVIRGISESKLKKIRPYVTVSPPPKKPQVSPPTSSEN
jgi:competence ComEA-like helix-hairpin-helix protein